MEVKATDARKGADKEFKPSDELPDGAPDALKAATDAGPHRDSDLAPDSPEEAKGMDAEKAEASALDFICGSPHALMYDVPVTVDIPGGQSAGLTFIIRQLDGARIIALEDEHTSGIGPFARLDDTKFNAALVAEGTVKIVEKDKDDKVRAEMDPRSEKFISGFGSPAVAMEKRFSFQAGLLSGIAGQIRSVSGWRPDRVGIAERPVRDAVGNSSGGGG